MKGHEQPAIVNTNSQDETSASDIIGFSVRDNRGGGGLVSWNQLVLSIPSQAPIHSMD